MMTSFSLAGLPSSVSFWIPPPACGSAALPTEYPDSAAVVTPKAENTLANRLANTLRVKSRFICALLRFRPVGRALRGIGAALIAQQKATSSPGDVRHCVETA